METRELICINCPLGCGLVVTMEHGTVMTAPARILTSSVRVRGGKLPVVSVKTASDIPKAKVKECAAALKKIEIQAPVAIGDVVVKDICHTGVDLIATRNVQMK